MKSNYLIGMRAVALLFMSILLVQCSEIPEGFIPDKVIYVQNPFVIQQGVEISTAPPNINGASYPLKFRLLATEDSNGEMSTILTDSIPTRIWTKPYDFNTDKTIEDINAKITTVKAPVMRISPPGGQISFSSASSEIPIGEYKVSVEMTNSAGTKSYKDVFTAVITGGQPFWVLPGGEGAYSWNSQVGSWGPAADAGVYDLKQDPSGANEIDLVICDKNGNPFDWENREIINRGTERSKLEDVCFEVPIYGTDKATFKYPFAPFPFAPGGREAYQYCYRILGDYIKYDDSARSGYMNIVINFRVLSAGKWTVKIKFPAITRVPK